MVQFISIRQKKKLWRILVVVLTLSTSLILLCVWCMIDCLTFPNHDWIEIRSIWFLLSREEKNETHNTIVHINIVLQKKIVISTVHSTYTLLPPVQQTVHFSLFLLFFFLAAMPNCESERTHERTIINKCWRLTVNLRLNATHTCERRGSTMWMTKIAWSDSKFDIGSILYSCNKICISIFHNFTHRWRHLSIHSLIMFTFKFSHFFWTLSNSYWEVGICYADGYLTHNVRATIAS